MRRFSFEHIHGSRIAHPLHYTFPKENVTEESPVWKTGHTPLTVDTNRDSLNKSFKDHQRNVNFLPSKTTEDKLQVFNHDVVFINPPRLKVSHEHLVPDPDNFGTEVVVIHKSSQHEMSSHVETVVIKSFPRVIASHQVGNSGGSDAKTSMSNIRINGGPTFRIYA